MTQSELENLKPGTLVWTIWSDKIQKAKFGHASASILTLELLREGKGSNRVTQFLEYVFLKESEAANHLISRYLEEISSKRKFISDTIQEVNELEQRITELQKLQDRADMEALTVEWFDKLAEIAKKAPPSPSAKHAAEGISKLIIERIKD